MRRKNEKLVKKLKELIKSIKDEYNLSCVILFGSQARGDFLPYSDIDLMVIGDFKEKFIDRAINIYKKFDGEQAIDVFCYTPEEFDVMFFKGVVSTLDSIDEGIPLWGNEFFNKYQGKLAKLKQIGLKKDPPVWILPKKMVIE